MTITDARKTINTRKKAKKTTELDRTKKEHALKRAACTGIAAFVLLSSQFAYAADTEIQEDYERVIAHGGGAYRGYETSNSVEALNHSIENGYKIIELDMDFSSDQRIIMIHDWNRTAKNYFGTTFENKITQKKFLKLTVYDQFEVLTFDKLAQIMAKNKEIRIITDTKGDNLALLTKISTDYPDLVERILPQIYEYDQYEQVKALGYTDIIFTLYAMPEIDIQKLIRFALEKELYAVTMPDYMAERGYCSQIAKKGIKVYVHPVSDFEGAMAYLKMGAYGVYSGTLLPEEFSGLEKDHYLIVSGGSKITKLDDEKVESLLQIKIYGLAAGERVSYSIDGLGQYDQLEKIPELSEGKHQMKVTLYDKQTLLGSLNYFLWKDADQYRILQEKFEYRLDAAVREKDFDSVMETGKVQEELVAILEHSLIAKDGEHTFYSDGNAEVYTNGEEFLPVQHYYGKILLPLGTTLKQLGAESVSMSDSKDIAIQYKNEKYLVMVDSALLRKGFLIKNVNVPVRLYRNKAMAGSEVFQCITGRCVLEKDGFMILLPDGVNPDSKTASQLFKAAGLLY